MRAGMMAQGTRRSSGTGDMSLEDPVPAGELRERLPLSSAPGGGDVVFPAGTGFPAVATGPHPALAKDAP